MKEQSEGRACLAVSGVEYVEESLSYFCNIVKGLGVKYIELWPQHMEDGLSAVRKELERNGLKVACVNCPVAPNRPEPGDWQRKIIQAIEVAANLGASFVSTFLGTHPARDDFTTIELYRRRIKSCLEVAQKHEVTILVENEFEPQGQELTRTASGTLLLLEAIDNPWLRLNFDPCNFYIAGEEPFPRAYQMLKPYISYIHIKDATRYSSLLHGSVKEHKVFTSHIGQFICVPLGEGGVNYHGLLRQLKIDGYRGFLTIEPHTTREQLLPTYDATLDTLRKWMET